MNKLVSSTLFTGLLFIAHGTWAACQSDMDLQGYKVLNLTMEDDKTPSEAVTVEYLKKVTSDRRNSNSSMFSNAIKNNLTWAEAIQYCRDLESPGITNDESQAPTSQIYSDWQLPTLEDWSAGCFLQGSTIEVNVVEEVDYYIDNKEHPQRIWTPAGVCQNLYFDVEKIEDSVFWWVNRHSLETVDHEDIPFEANTNTLDPVYKGYPPELDGVLRAVQYGQAEAWNPNTSILERVPGNEKMAVRCMR